MGMLGLVLSIGSNMKEASSFRNYTKSHKFTYVFVRNFTIVRVKSVGFILAVILSPTSTSYSTVNILKLSLLSFTLVFSLIKATSLLKLIKWVNSETSGLEETISNKQTFRKSLKSVSKTNKSTIGI
jgi:hypothetical protein